MKISITDSARDKLKEIIASSELPHPALRLVVAGVG